MLLVLMTAAGYVAGTLIALFLDRLYTGAPWRGPLRLCIRPASRANSSGETGGTPLEADICEPAPPSRHTMPEPFAAGALLPWHVYTGTPGYLLVRGRCPAGTRLVARLWYLPLLGAGAGAAIARYAVDVRHGALVALFGLVLLAFVGTDFERHLLPNRLMYPALAAGVALSWAWPERGSWSSLVGGAAGFAIMFVLFLVLPGFGFGDVKLAGLLGLVSGLDHLPSALIIGILAGGGGSGFMLVFRRAGRKTAIAYGPYLALGAFVGMLLV